MRQSRMLAGVLRSSLVGLAVLGCSCVRCQVDSQVMRAIGEARSLSSALAQYAERCGGFPRDLEALLPSRAGPTCDALGVIDARGYGVLGDEPSATRFSWRYEPLDRRPGTNVHAHFVLTATAQPNRLAKILPFVDDEPRQSVWTSDEGRITTAAGRPATGADPALH